MLRMFSRLWRVNISVNNFETCIFFEGTEPEVVDYVNSELGDYATSYTGAASYEITKAKELGMKIYMAPKK